MPEPDPPPIEPGRGRLRYDKERRTIVAESELQDRPCKWCGAPVSLHDYQELARHCYPMQIEAKDAEIKRLRVKNSELCSERLRAAKSEFEARIDLQDEIKRLRAQIVAIRDCAVQPTGISMEDLGDWCKEILANTHEQSDTNLPADQWLGPEPDMNDTDWKLTNLDAKWPDEDDQKW